MICRRKSDVAGNLINFTIRRKEEYDQNLYILTEEGSQ